VRDGHEATSLPASGRTTRVRGLAAWEPQQKTRALLEQVRAVLAEYADHLPLTIRQIFYRLVGASGYDKTEKAYSRLGEHLNRARRAGLIPFDAIRDDGVTVREPVAWSGPRELAEAFLEHARGFRLDRQEGQPQRLMFIVEAGGMIPQIERIADPFGIRVQSCGGFDSLTAKRDLADMLGERPIAEVLHIGDHDPSGTHVFSSMAEDVQALARDLGLPGTILFSRLAVTPEQIDALGLPTAAAKETDKRSFSGETTQAEAIPPDELARIVRGAIDDRVDFAALRRVLNREKKYRRRLTARLRPLLTEWEGGGA
jgi:hypothetical protein